MITVLAEQDVMVKLLQYKKEAGEELQAILSWWAKYMPDEKNGGFYGSVSNNNQPDHDAPKGIVLYSRILWTFSAAYRLKASIEHIALAQKAFDYIVHHFLDTQYGGVYWSVDAKGNCLDGRKQVYGLAFCIYGMAEYYRVTGNDAALNIAKELYGLIEKYSHDKERGGYIEAFARDWSPVGDLRLSDKDENEKKTMNTHLHIIEAYANLYSVWPDAQLYKSITSLLEIFHKHIINNKNQHLNLFMDEDWNNRSSLISFGHDIEAAWLLLECAEVTGDKNFIDQCKQKSITLADAAAEGLDNDGGLWYEYHASTNHWIKEKHSWPQAEAMVGFLNAFEVSGNEKYLQYSLDAFAFVNSTIKDKEKGEWFWGVDENGSVMEKEKAGFWKCPYHSSRACIEIIKRIYTTGDAG